MPATILNAVTSCEIWTEGKTDWRHLKRAQTELGRANGAQFHEKEEVAMGDDALLSKCKTFCQTYQSRPQIFVFDRDNKAVLKEVTAAPYAYENWGNNVFSFALPVPKHRANLHNLCIELYYSDAELRAEDTHGRRLYLTSEFNETGCLLADPQVRVGNRHVLKGATAPNAAKIVDSDVFRADRSIALSKADFAEAVFQRIAPFASVDFSAFSEVFDIIDAIVTSTRPTTDPIELDLSLFFSALEAQQSPRDQLISLHYCPVK